MKTRRKITAAVITALGLVSGASAQTDEQLQEIVVVANRIPLPVRQIGTSVSVLDAEEIRAHGNVALTDVLRQLPAVGTSRNGGLGSITTLRIRGEEGFRTLTLLDGLKLSDPSSTQVTPQLEHLVSSGIGRVEVLRGPQGLSYGADAGGVISISSQRAREGFNASLDAESGEFGSNQIAANVGGANERGDFFLSVTDFETDGYNTRQSDTVLQDDDGYRNTTIHARLGYNLSDSLRVDLVHRDVDGETEFDGCWAGTTVHDCESIYDLQATRLSATYTGAALTHSLAYSTVETDRDSLALGVSSFASFGELERVEYVGSANELPGFDLVFGVDLERETNNAEDRDNKGYYLEYLSDFSDSFFLTAGVRQDDNDDFGEHTSYRLTTAYLLGLGGDTLKFKASYGSGFRAPSPFEVSYNAGAFAYPPASLTRLEEEKSEGFEAGVEYYLGNRAKLEAVYFDQEVEDAIYFDLAAFSGYLQDIGTSSSEGFELSGEITLSDAWRVTANYTNNDTERPNGQQRIRRPEELANLGLMYSGLNDRLHINAFYRISRDSIDEVFGSAVAREDFEVLDLNASYRVSDTLELYARLENGFDDDYAEIVGFNSPGRASYLGLRLSF